MNIFQATSVVLLIEKYSWVGFRIRIKERGKNRFRVRIFNAVVFGSELFFEGWIRTMCFLEGRIRVRAIFRRSASVFSSVGSGSTPTGSDTLHLGESSLCQHLFWFKICYFTSFVLHWQFFLVIKNRQIQSDIILLWNMWKCGSLL